MLDRSKKSPSKENIFHERYLLSGKLNDIEAKIPILVVATSEELSLPENHFNMSEEEKALSRAQLFTKKGKIFAYKDNKAITKNIGIACDRMVLFGKPQQISPASILQDEILFTSRKEIANQYLQKVLNVPTAENDAITYLNRIIYHLYTVIKNAQPRKDETIHFVTMERDLMTPDSGKNQLAAEFCKILLEELRYKISENNETWNVALDRVLGSKHRTSRAESYGIHKFAQQPLMLYQSRNIEEETISEEKVIIVDDHIQAGGSLAAAISGVKEKNANLLSIVCISAHKNSQFFNIQPDVKEFIINLLPNTLDSIPKLNQTLKIVGLNLETLTNMEGFLLAAILSDSNNQEHRTIFESLLKKYDATNDIKHPLFRNQSNSLMYEFEKSKVEFADLENELRAAIIKGRYTVPYTKQKVLSDEDGQKIRKEFNNRSELPWLLFDFDDTFHYFNNSTFIFFQKIIQKYTGVEIPLETIKKTRQELKDKGQYQYEEMLMSFIKQHHPSAEVSINDIIQTFEEYKNQEPFIPKISKADFLSLRSQYRIGIITDNLFFESMVSKMKAFYGVDIDGYIHNDRTLSTKPSTAMYQEFCKIYDVKTKPIAYVGDQDDLDGKMAKNANLQFISVDPMQSTIDMEKFTKELHAIEEKRKSARMRWGLLKEKMVTMIEDQKVTHHFP